MPNIVVTSAVDGSNNEQAFQSGGASLFHEVCHTLGLLHTFAPTSAPYDRSACVDADAVLDTPTTVNGVWDIPISTTAPYDWCCNAFDGVNDNFTVVYARKAAGLGARADEQTTALSSCQGTSSRLPYVPVRAGDRNVCCGVCASVPHSVVGGGCHPDEQRGG